MLAVLLSLRTTMKASMTKDGVTHYIDHLIDTAVWNFMNIDIPDIDENISLGFLHYNVQLKDISVTSFSVKDYNFDLNS